MDYINYLDEAVYFFNKFNCFDENKIPQQLNFKVFKELENKKPERGKLKNIKIKNKELEECKKLRINESIYISVMRILAANSMLDYKDNCFILNDEHIKKQTDILNNINKNQIKEYEDLFAKATDEIEFFFDRISDLEYEIYSRYNFLVTFETGKEIVKHIDLTNKKVLELGGNSGGLGTAFLSNYKDCSYFILDTKIPCKVGKEFKELYDLNIEFIEGNIFELKIEENNYSSNNYDYIIMMNLLHDFDDTKCFSVLQNCIRYCGSNTKIVIIEDILTNEFEPKEAVMHGLRLSIECKGGKQRTIEEFKKLFLKINYKPQKAIRLNEIHTMLIFEEQ